MNSKFFRKLSIINLTIPTKIVKADAGMTIKIT